MGRLSAERGPGLVVELEDAHIGYRGVSVVRGVSARFSGGVLLLGPNGAGKTTLLRGVAGIADVYRGRVLVDGVEVGRASGRAGLLAVNLPEAYRLLPLPVDKLLTLYMDLVGGDPGAALEIASRLGLGGELLRRRTLWQLSAGQEKIVTAAAALASGARNLVFDEPFEQLDPARKTRLLGMVRDAASRATVILATHETWVLDKLGSWKAYFMVSGRLSGPIEAGELASLRVVRGRRPDAVLTIQLEDGYVSLVRGGEGPGLSELVTLDRLYDLLLS